MRFFKPATRIISRAKRQFFATSRLAAVTAGLLVSSATALYAQGGGLQLGGEPSGNADSAGVIDLGATPAEDTTTAGGDASGLSASAATSAEPVGQITRSTHGAWEVACGGGNCAMAQVGQDAQGNPVLEMVLRKLDEPLAVGEQRATAVLDIITPLGVVLTEGVGLKIDSGPLETAPFQICTEQGCLVREPIDDALVTRLKRGNVATVSVIAAAKGEVTSDISLSGFTAAYNAM